MGVLEGMTGLSTSRNIEILPTFTAVKFGSLGDTGSFVNLDTEPEGGVNFKYGVTSNLTADLTFNPDFSQIESDRPQIEVNHEIQPDRIDALLLAGRAAHRLGDLPGAENLLRRAAKVAPDSAEPHQRLGQLLAAQSGRMDEAMAEFNAAHRLRGERWV